MRNRAANRITAKRIALALAAFALALTSLFYFPSFGSRSAAQLRTTAPATTSTITVNGAKVDPLLVKTFGTLATGTPVPVVITYNSQPQQSELDRLQAVGITKGITLQRLPMVIAPMTAAQLAAVQTQAGVRSIWANRIMKTFTNESRRFIGVPQLMADGEATRANRANPGIPFSGKGIGIGYLDTGADATHEDLKYGSKIVQNVIQPISEATVGDGGLVVGIGYNIFDILYSEAGFYKPVYVEDQLHSDIESGHGTFGAAVAAGTGAQSGGFYGGVAPGANLVVVNSGNELGLPLVAILGAFDYFMVNQFRYNIRVINNSWGDVLASGPEGLSPDNPINIATRAAHDSNMVVVFAAGNGIAGDGEAEGAINPYSTMPWTISVAAGYKRGFGTPTSFSSRGVNDGEGVDVAGMPADPSAPPNLRPDITAPGIDIKSARMKGVGITNTAGTWLGNDSTTIPPAYLPFYTTSQGTSFSCPHVSGVVALMLEANSTLTPDDVVAILRGTATPMPFTERVVGAGYVDAHNAVRRVLGLAAVDHPAVLIPPPGSPEIIDPYGDQIQGTGMGGGAATDAQDIISADYAYDAAHRQIVYTLELQSLAVKAIGNSWLMSHNFKNTNVYVTATVTTTGTVNYTYGKITPADETQSGIAEQVNIGNCDSGQIVGNKIIIRLSVDKLKAPGALGYDVVGMTTTATEARAQVGIGLLYASDIGNGADFKIE
ncbi:MAG TPA: S8 family serine peptidase [Pyrinomonadaceae bacterium]|jgi:subtilisin family serine protease